MVRIFTPWRWAHRIPLVIARETAALLGRLWTSRATLRALTIIEFRRRYAGSVLGLAWYPLYSLLLLTMYSFVYMIVLKVRVGELQPYQYVLFIFAGLVPYLGFSEAIATGTTSVRANIALVRNTVFPIELVPLKHLLVALGGLSFSLAIVVAMTVLGGKFGPHTAYLPVPLVLLFLFTAGVVWVFSGIAALIPDASYLVNIVLIFFLFVSPIGYSLEQVPDGARVFLYANPMTFLIDSFRFALLGERVLPYWADGAFALFAAVCFATGGTLFRRLMPLFSDHV